MLKIRAEKSADERYPAAMARLRRLTAEIPEGPLGEQISSFLERAVLSKWDGVDPARGAREPAHASLDERPRVLARVHRGRRGFTASRRLANVRTDSRRNRRGAAPAVRRHDARARPARVDARRDTLRQADARSSISRRGGPHADDRGNSHDSYRVASGGGQRDDERRVRAGDERRRGRRCAIHLRARRRRKHVRPLDLRRRERDARAAGSALCDSTSCTRNAGRADRIRCRS